MLELPLPPSLFGALLELPCRGEGAAAARRPTHAPVFDDPARRPRKCRRKWRFRIEWNEFRVPATRSDLRRARERSPVLCAAPATSSRVHGSSGRAFFSALGSLAQSPRAAAIATASDLPDGTLYTRSVHHGASLALSSGGCGARRAAIAVACARREPACRPHRQQLNTCLGSSGASLERAALRRWRAHTQRARLSPSLPHPTRAQGIDLVAGGRNKKVHRTAPKSENVYLKLLVKVRRLARGKSALASRARARPSPRRRAHSLTSHTHTQHASSTASSCAARRATSTRSCSSACSCRRQTARRCRSLSSPSS